MSSIHATKPFNRKDDRKVHFFSEKNGVKHNPLHAAAVCSYFFLMIEIKVSRARGSPLSPRQ